MGIYVNPGNKAFRRIVGPNYIDKTGLIGLINDRIDGDDSLVCISRPRRFGKSYAAKMLTAYYDCTCDSHALFDDKKIAQTEKYEMCINQYNVIYLEITSFISTARRKGISLGEVPNMIVDVIGKELRILNPEFGEDMSLTDMMIHYIEKPEGRPFVFIIDEWDAVIREAKDDEDAQNRYLDLLREWFKNGTFTPKVVAAAYMTGILPIKKDGSQSAISEFDEFSMLDPLDFAEFVGFTENEVMNMTTGKNVDFEQVKAWYDGYDFPGIGAVYNPYSVVSAVKTGKCRSYWRKTSAANPLKDYIDMDFEGLQATVARLIAGERIVVNVDNFQNDFETFESADDILTLLVHLGYLTYHEEDCTVQIPNEEVRLEFNQFLSRKHISMGWLTLIRRSKKLLDDTIAGKGDAVAKTIEEIRGEQYAPQFYNDEQALRVVIKYAYIAAFGQYVKIEEMPSGKGIADVAFIPSSTSRLPALVVELKWNKSKEGAIAQIKKREYMSVLKSFDGEILLVGINYDEKTKVHSCKIEMVK